jgi:hypothetical protein
VYKYTNNVWTQLGLDIDGEALGDQSGYSVSLSSDGTTVAIGAVANDGISTNTVDNRGHVRVYKIINGSYVPYGVGLDKLKAAGYLATDLKAAGYSQSDITTAGYTQTTMSSLTNFADLLKTVTEGSFNIVAPESTNSVGVLSYKSSNPLVATVSGSVVTIVSAGTTVITATQGETETYYGATIQSTLRIVKLSKSLSNFVILPKTLSQGSFNIVAPESTNSTEGAFSYASSVASVATVSGSTVTLVGEGTTVITATQSETSTYYGATIECTLTVIAKVESSLSIGSVSGKTYGDIAFQIPVTTNSTGGISYSSSIAGVATVSSSGLVTIFGAGTTTLTVVQETDGSYFEKTVTSELTIGKASVSLSMSGISAKTYGDAPFQITVSSSSAGAAGSTGGISYLSSNSSVATVSSTGLVTIVGVGTSEITANQEVTENYNSGLVKSVLTVNASSASNPTVISGGSGLSYYLTTSAGYASLSGDIALASGKLVASGGKKVIKASKRLTIKRG